MTSSDPLTRTVFYTIDIIMSRVRHYLTLKHGASSRLPATAEFFVTLAHVDRCCISDPDCVGRLTIEFNALLHCVTIFLQLRFINYLNSLYMTDLLHTVTQKRANFGTEFVMVGSIHGLGWVGLGWVGLDWVGSEFF